MCKFLGEETLDEDFPHHHSAAEKEVEIAAYRQQEAVEALYKIAGCVVADPRYLRASLGR